jgi:D-glycero-D-manno-heptose 1,7-bisphosphate phosphatase
VTAETGGLRGAVFLDRDGVINRKAPEGAYVRNWSEFELLPGVTEALLALRTAGRPLFVVTNQRGVARGVVRATDVYDIHIRLTRQLRSIGVDLEGIYVCPHEKASCDCRKPGTGLFLDARRDRPWICFRDSDMIGDSLNDLQAGARLGMRLWLVGDEERSRSIVRAAERAGIRVSGWAPSLLALVEQHEDLRRTEPVAARS